MIPLMAGRCADAARRFAACDSMPLRSHGIPAHTIQTVLFYHFIHYSFFYGFAQEFVADAGFLRD